jgi:hypothetical protein
VGLENIVPLVEMPASVFGVNEVPVVGVLGIHPSHPSALVRSVQTVCRVIPISKIRSSVVISIMINMVNNMRLFTMKNAISNAMGFIRFAPVSNNSVSGVSVNGTSQLAPVSVSKFIPSKRPSIGVVIKDIAERLRYKSDSHSDTSYVSLVRGLAVVAVSTPILLSGCATAKGNARHSQHGADQVRIVAVQREAMVQEAKADSLTQQALVDALARVAEANPQHAPSVAVALAVIGVKGSQDKPSNTPIVSLQRPTNEALEWTKALAPTVGGLITGVGIAAINAETQRNASDNNKDILLGDQTADRGIVEAVAGLGSIAAAQTGISVGGNYLQVSDNGSIDQSTTTDNSQNETTSIEGDVNTGVQADGSYNSSSMGVADTPATYLGTTGTVQELIDYLANFGVPYTLTLNGAVVASSTTGTGTPITIDCNSVAFSPRPAQCQ